MSLITPLMRDLSLITPIVQAPMAGDTTTAELTASVSNAGGLGSIGAAYMTPEQIAQIGTAVRRLTDRPFAINLFAPQVVESTSHSEAVMEIMRQAHEALGIDPPTEPKAPLDSAASLKRFEQQLDAALNSGARVFSFTFGALPAATIERIQKAGLYCIGTATTVAEALALEKSGVNAIAAQGSEAGAHRGTFLSPFEDAMIGTMALVPQMVDAVKIPVIASGGIMDGRGIVAAMALGAQAVQMGTAFLSCHESGAPERHKAMLQTARPEETRLTRAFSGRHARGIRNHFMAAMGAHEWEVLPFPLQNTLTGPMRKAAAAQGNADYLSLWSGQGLGLCRRIGAGELVTALVREAEQIRQQLFTG